MARGTWGRLLLRLAAEAVVPGIGGCAAALLADQFADARLGHAVGRGVEKAINCFGQAIVQQWMGYFRSRPPEERVAAVMELAALPAAESRQEAAALIERLAPAASAADRAVAVEYLTSIPRSVQRSLVTDRKSGGLSLPPALALDDPRSLVQLLPTNVPPYPVPHQLPGTDYSLEELIGTGGFGAVYRARDARLPYLPLAIKFCLDPALSGSLKQERAHLERLMQTGGTSWSPRIVRLYGYNLDYRTPFLVYEYVPGGDLQQFLTARQSSKKGGLTPGDALRVITIIADGLAFAHEHGLVHRDLKPANVLLSDNSLKLADFGIGGVVSTQASQGSRIGTVESSQLSLAEQVSLYRGAGTPLYMSPEQRRGAPPDPRQDLYSLGVIWYQLLTNDVTRELHAGWARELEAQFHAPRPHMEILQKCVGWIDERPRDGRELLKLLRPLAGPSDAKPSAIPVVVAAPRPTAAKGPLAAVVPAAVATSGPSRQLLLPVRLRQLLACHRGVLWYQRKYLAVILGAVLGMVLAGVVGGIVFGICHSILAPSYPTYPTHSGSYDDKGAKTSEWKVAQRAYDLNLQSYYAQSRTAENVGGWLGGLTGITLWGLTIWWLRRVWQRRLPRAEQLLAGKIQEIASEFPAEVRTWGGTTVLKENEAVRAIVRAHK